MIHTSKAGWLAVGLAFIALSPTFLPAGEATKTQEADWPPKPAANDPKQAIYPTQEEKDLLIKLGQAYQNTKSDKAYVEGRDLAEALAKRMTPSDPGNFTKAEWDRWLKELLDLIDVCKNPKKAGSFGVHSGIFDRYEDAFIQWAGAAKTKPEFFTRLTWVLETCATLSKIRTPDTRIARRCVVMFTSFNQKEFSTPAAVKLFCTQLVAASSALKNDKDFKLYMETLE